MQQHAATFHGALLSWTYHQCLGLVVDQNSRVLCAGIFELTEAATAKPKSQRYLSHCAGLSKHLKRWTKGGRPSEAPESLPHACT
jgi:hypothetical protein